MIEKAGSTQSLCDSFYVFLAASSRFLVLTINKEYILHSAKMLNCVGGKNGKKYSIIFLFIANTLWVPISDIELGLGHYPSVIYITCLHPENTSKNMHAIPIL